MIKQNVHKIFSVSLAVLVLFSTLSFTIEKHFCGNTLVDVALFTQAEKCKMETPNQGVTEKTLKKSCCKDTVDLIAGQNELNFNSEFDFKTINKLVAAAFVVTYVNLYEELHTQIIPHKNYSPPNLVFDLNILDQVFII